MEEKLQNRLIMHVTMPMATSQIEARIRALMQPQRKRSSMERRSITITAFAAAIILLPLAAMRPMAQAGAALRPPATIDRGIVVVVDAGHGGQDSGAVGLDGTLEKNINLAVAEKLKETLTRAGRRVFMTRTGDTSLPLMDRPAFVKANQAQYFVSLHCDSRGANNSKSGIVVYFHGDDVKGKLLAADVAAHLTHVAALPNHGILSDKTRFPPQGFGVLRGSPVPAVLVECGSVNNSRDLSALKQGQTQQQIADSIAAGLEQFKTDYKPIQAKIDFVAYVHVHNKSIVEFWDGVARNSDIYSSAVKRHKPELLANALTSSYVFNGRPLTKRQAVAQLQYRIDEYGSRHYKEDFVKAIVPSATMGVIRSKDVVFSSVEHWGLDKHGKGNVTFSRRDTWRKTPVGWRLAATEESQLAVEP